MQGKIVLEEHFAVPQTMGDSAVYAMAGSWDELGAKLLDFEDIRLKEMDAHGIEYAIQSLNSPAIQAILDPKEAVETARIANDHLAAQVARRPDRFAGFAALPMQDPQAAAEELTRCMKELGFKGALVNGFTQKHTPETVIFYDAPEYRPFWAQVEALNAPFYLHPRDPVQPYMHWYEGHPWFEGSAWAFAAETSMHALRLLASGIFDEHPGLTMILGHLGERIPYDIWRLDHRMSKSPRGVPAKRKIGDYLRDNCYLTTSGNFRDSTLHCAIAEMGVERILFSVDYPFEQTADGTGWIERAALSEADRTRIARTNAIRLFNLALG